MKKGMLLLWLLSFHLCGFTQIAGHATRTKNNYRETAPTVNDLLHTKLKIAFDYQRSYANGEAWLTVKPHFYATAHLQIDAKGMEILALSLVKGNTLVPLEYTYNKLVLDIKLDKLYTPKEKYTIYIKYNARPEEVEGANMLNKGLYFINPRGADKDKPIQIWTQGEPEATSVWCPTIDKPNQRSSQEIYITVPEKFVTLSNGVLKHSKRNGDNTRTDYWKLDIPHAPYLFFIAVGDFAIVRDNYHGKEVSYYVEKPYANMARRIFGHTIDMISCFSKMTGMDYPWPKYAQIVVRDYPGGGMENTAAVVFGQGIQQNARLLTDGNEYEDLMAHELFHHWFGNYVTAESWSNLVLSEAFATYGEQLWKEYRYGRDKADEMNYNGLLRYVYNRNENKELVRFYYDNKEEMFDEVIYNKGARVLHLLRSYVGDSAFFKAISLYLNRHKLASVEIHDLRLAFEEVTGKDMNWFFEQWFLGTGHPKLEISYVYNDTLGRVTVGVKQLQKGKLFFAPLKIDIYENGKKIRHLVELSQKEQSFVFQYSKRPELVNIDADKTLICDKTDLRKLATYIFQFTHAGTYVDKREAIDACIQLPEDARSLAFFKTALRDKFEGIVFHTLMTFNFSNKVLASAMEPDVSDLAINAGVPRIRARAIQLLGDLQKKEYLPVFKQAVMDSSYHVSGEALAAILKLDSAQGIQMARLMSRNELKGKLYDVVTALLMHIGSDEDFDFLANTFDQMPVSQQKINVLPNFADCLDKLNSVPRLKKGIDIILSFRDAIPAPYKTRTDGLINNVILQSILDKQKIKLETAPDPEMELLLKYLGEKIGDR
jgi:aminopeptidase N